MNHLLLAVDDGWTNANYNWADLFFIIAVVLSVVAALLHAVGVPASGTDTQGHLTTYRYHHHSFTLLALAVACGFFGLFLL